MSHLVCPLCRHSPGCNNTNVCALKLRLEFRETFDLMLGTGTFLRGLWEKKRMTVAEVEGLQHADIHTVLTGSLQLE